MKIITTVSVKLAEASIVDMMQIDRTDQPMSDIIYKWCRSEPRRRHTHEGRVFEDLAIAGFDRLRLLEDGTLDVVLETHDPTPVTLRERFGPRTDIGIIRVEKDRQFLFNVFIEADGSHSGPNGVRYEDYTAEDEATLNGAVTSWMQRYQAHVRRQLRWFTEMPWRRLQGLTVMQAIQLLTEMGWGDRRAEILSMPSR